MTDFPFVPWSQFETSIDWAPGQHLTAVAPTGAGKTFLFKALMKRRRYSIMFGTKPDDPMYWEIIKEHGYKRVASIDDVKPWDDRILIWPNHKTINQTVATQRREFLKAMDVVVNQGGWSVWIDEAKYVSEFLGLRRELTFMLEQLRSVKASVICGAQRPTYLPLSALANSSHVFLWKSANRDDARKLADVGGIDAREVALQAKSLGKHEFLYVSTRGTDSRIVRSQVGREK